MSNDSQSGAESTVGEHHRLTPERRLTLNLSAEEREAVFCALTRGVDDMEIAGSEEAREMAEDARSVYSKLVQEGYDAE